MSTLERFASVCGWSWKDYWRFWAFDRQSVENGKPNRYENLKLDYACFRKLFSEDIRLAWGTIVFFHTYTSKYVIWSFFFEFQSRLTSFIGQQNTKVKYWGKTKCDTNEIWVRK